MAVIGKIRKRVGILIAFVGVSMVAFIMGDLFSNNGILNSSSDVVGVIGGEKVRYSEFEKRVERLTENYKLNTQSDNLDQNTQDMLREQAWGMYLNENTLGEEYKKLGLSCSPEELYDMITGPNPHAQIKQAFTDPKTGQFDASAVVKFLKDLPNRDEATQRQWKQFEDAIRDERITTKYNNLIKGGFYVPGPEAKNHFMETQRMASIKFFRLDYNTIPDSAVSVSDSDLKAYYNANKNKYKQSETQRKVEYVAWDVTPSADDRLQAQEWINEKANEFAQTTADIAFVNQYSDVPFDSNYFAKGSLPMALDTIFFRAAIGTMVGPYEDGDTWKVSKLIGEKMVPDSVKARHILINAENGDMAKAKAIADSLKEAIKKGAKFADLAKTFSKDPGSGEKGGDLGWFRQGVMVPPFNDACFNGKKGDMPIVESQFGVHLIEILDKGVPAKQVQVATVERKVEASQRTFDDTYNKASQFGAANRSGEEFEAAIIKQGLNKRIADNLREADKNVPGLESPRELVRWAYSAKKGEVSKVFTLGDKFVVAHLVDIREKGTLPMESVIDQVTAEVRKEKKAAMLIEKINAANGTDIDAMAQKLNTVATDADNINFQNPYIPGIGNEAKVTGTIFGLKQGQLSKPIKGDAGVSVVFVKSFTEPAATEDYSASVRQLQDQRKSRSEYEVFNALKEKAKVEDNRGKFY